jgi:subtilisin family serine protease
MNAMARHYLITIRNAQAMRRLQQALLPGINLVDQDVLIRISGDVGKEAGTYILPAAAAVLVDPTAGGATGALNNLIGFGVDFSILNDSETFEAIYKAGFLESDIIGDNDQFSRAAESIHLPRAHEENPEALLNLQHVKIGHFDTGVTKHPVFGYSSISSPQNEGTILFDQGKDFVSVGRLPIDPWPESPPYPGVPGHGTRTASVIVGKLPNDQMNGPPLFTGVAPGAPLVPYRIDATVILLSLTGSIPLDRAITAALDRGCGVLSLSMGAPVQMKNETEEAIDAAYQSGVIFVCASGNVVPSVVWPAKYSRTIAVGGSTVSKNQPWAGASRGPEVDISAPADLVFRANWRGAGGVAKAVYGANAGTSYAAALVAGAAALWLAKFKDHLGNYQGWRRVELFRRLLRDTATIPKVWPTGVYGTGILNVAALLSIGPANWPVLNESDLRQSATLD